jgi:hypothetical protein
MKTILITFCLSVGCLQNFLFAQTKPNRKKAFEHVKYLASDQFKGRKSGTPEYQKAAEYVAAKMAEFGLRPGGDNGSYFQEVTFKNWRNFEQPIRLELNSPENRKYFAGRTRDFSPTQGTGSGIVNGQLVFAGYGVISEKHNWNDYENIDARGKIVLLIPDVPDTVVHAEIPDTLQGREKQQWLINQRIKTAAEQGAPWE